MGVMIAKRIIPCLNVHDGKVTRGVQFGKAEAAEAALPIYLHRVTLKTHG
jgi:imidazole glycerol phosphate synthase subunit HisF